MLLKISNALFLCLIIFCPLAFGTTEPWSYAVMEIATALAGTFFFLSCLKHKRDLYHVPGLLPLLLFGLFMLATLIPLPPGLVKMISAKAFEIQQNIDHVTGQTGWMTLSLNFKATVSEFFRYATYVIFYFLTVQLLSRKMMLKSTALVVALFGGLLAFSSILQFYLTEDMALWIRHSPLNSIVVGPYANHNHYAGLMEMIFPITLGLFFFYRPKTGNTSLIKGIAEIFNQEKANIHLLIGASTLLVITSVFVSLSRGAMISTCLSLFIFIALMLNRRINRGNTIVLIFLVIIAALSIGWFGWDQIIERFANLKNAQGIIHDTRLDFWENTFQIIRDFSLTGAGIGTFQNIYPLYRSIGGDRILTHAHNDYLELLAEGGIFGFALLACFIIILFYKTFQQFKKRRDAFCIYLYTGAVTGICALLLHSFTDFNLHIGANGLWFFFLAGLCVCAANTGLQQAGMKTRLPGMTMPGIKPVCTSAAVLLLFAVTIYNFSNLAGRLYYQHIRGVAIDTQTEAAKLGQIEKIAGLAVKFDPLMSSYRLKHANALWFLNQPDTAEQQFITALKIDPLNAGVLNRYAIFLSREKNSDKAESAYKLAADFGQAQPEFLYRYGIWLLSENRVEEGLKYIKTTLKLDGSYFSKAVTSMIIAGLSKPQIEQTISDHPMANIAYARFLAETGDLEKAADRYLATLANIKAYINKIPHIQPSKIESAPHLKNAQWYYLQVFYFFHKRGDKKNALLVLQEAEKNLPLDVKIKTALGDFFYRQGILYKAEEKYQYALFLDPENVKAREMLKKINP